MDNLPKGDWWSVFHDDKLNDLEQQALDANQDLKVSVARLQQARASAAVQVSTLFPTFGLVPNTNQPSAERVRESAGRVLEFVDYQQYRVHAKYVRAAFCREL